MLEPAWMSKPIKQEVVYEDTEGVQTALAKLQQLPPLVTPQEVCELRRLIGVHGAAMEFY